MPHGRLFEEKGSIRIEIRRWTSQKEAYVLKLFRFKVVDALSREIGYERV